MTDRDIAAPAHWEADVLLSDGAVAHVRPVLPDDGPAIAAMHARMSDRSRYLRYFTAVQQLSSAQMRVFTDTDQVEVIGLAAQRREQMIAVATCHRDPRDPASAEVAFVVEDAQQRRGLGSILLEHLAAAAGERGITRFTAEVLAENRSMAAVFADAGYEIRRRLDSGIIDLVFDIAPTETSRAVSRAREHRAEARSIARLLHPRSVAVLGAPDTEDSPTLAGALLRALRSGGFTGEVHPIPTVGPASRSGEPADAAWPGLTALPGPVDLAVLAVPEGALAAAVSAAAAARVHGLVVLGGGGGATGGPGMTRAELLAAARAGGMRLLGPNCLGLANTDPTVALNATLVSGLPAPGRIGLFCQSAALGLVMLAQVAERRLGISSFVSAGHRADVSGNDLLQFWTSDPRTAVAVLYLESFGNARKFARLTRAVARVKPVVVVRSARNAVVTPGLANSSRIPESALTALFAASGVIRADTVEAALDVAELLASQPIPRGDRVAVVGNSSALGVLALDSCLQAGLQVVDGVPLDLGAALDPARLRAAVAELAARPDVDVVLAVVADAGIRPAPDLDPGEPTDPGDPSGDPGGGVPVLHVRVAAPTAVGSALPPPRFATVERAVTALAHAVRYGRWLARPAGTVVTPAGIDTGAAERIVAGWVAAGSPATEMTDAEVSGLLACYGIEVADFAITADADEAVTAAGRIGYPVVVKTTEPALRHRVDRVGVRLRLTDAQQVRAAVSALRRISTAPVYVQAMIPPGRAQQDVVLSVTQDPSFGAVVAFSVGEIATTLLDDRAYAVVPVTDVDAEELIAAPRSAPLLTGFRGTTPVRTAALTDLVTRLSALADAHPQVRDISLRPVLVGPDGATVSGAAGRWGGSGRGEDERRRLR